MECWLQWKRTIRSPLILEENTFHTRLIESALLCFECKWYLIIFLLNPTLIPCLFPALSRSLTRDEDNFQNHSALFWLSWEQERALTEPGNRESCGSHLFCWMHAACFMFAFIQCFMPFPTGCILLLLLFTLFMLRWDIGKKNGLLWCLNK